jgi:hypothetical protein
MMEYFLGKNQVIQWHDSVRDYLCYSLLIERLCFKKKSVNNTRRFGCFLLIISFFKTTKEQKKLNETIKNTEYTHTQ